jgi:hypothetical protein
MKIKMTNNSPAEKSAGSTKLEAQKGLSLMEMGIAATVLAALILGVMMGIEKLNFDRKMSEVRKQVPVTISAAVDAFSTQPSTAILGSTLAGTKIMSSFNVWPANRIKDKGLDTVEVIGSFTGSREYMVTNYSTAAPRLRLANQGIAYWITNIPADACMPILQTLIAHSSVASIHVAEATITPGGTTTGSKGVGTYTNNAALTLNMVTATAACSTPGNKSLLALLSRT